MSVINENYINYLRGSLRKVIDDIEREIPDTSDNKMFISLLNAERRSLPYKAPEILSNSIQRIFDILVVYAPLENDVKNPQWKKNICDIWNAFGQDFRDKGAKMETNSSNNTAPN